MSDQLSVQSESPGSILLFRAVDAAEYELIKASGFRCFPPRLAGQPIFYPVLKEQYAREMAEDWNAKLGRSYVTRFSVKRAFLSSYDVHQVGNRTHLEYWIPSEHLEALNENIDGPIEVIAEFQGP